MPNDIKVDSLSNANGEEPTPFKSKSFPAPIAKLLGLKLLQAENGTAVVEFVENEFCERRGGPNGPPRFVSPGLARHSALAQFTEKAPNILY
jgi:hypothetical protein